MTLLMVVVVTICASLRASLHASLSATALFDGTPTSDEQTVTTVNNFTTNQISATVAIAAKRASQLTR
jgi:hypothetical protein